MVGGSGLCGLLGLLEQKTHSASKVGPFGPVLKASWDHFKVKTWFEDRTGSELGLEPGLGSVLCL